jgi:alpha-tubulin suppressor-like RCC1 family protein
MAASTPCKAALLDLPLEVLTCVCQQLAVRDLVRVAETCKLLRHGDGGPKTAELPTKSPVVTALLERAFPNGQPVLSTRPAGCSESWVAGLACCARQHRCRMAAGLSHSLLLDATGRVLAWGKGAETGHGGAGVYPVPTPVASLAGVLVRSVAAGNDRSLALSWDGRVYSWGMNGIGQLGHGDKRARPSPTLVKGLEGVRGIAAAYDNSLAVTQSGDVFRWGCDLLLGPNNELRPTFVEGLKGVRVRRVCAAELAAFANGEDGRVFSWGLGTGGLLGHGDRKDQPSPKRVQALRGVQVSSVAVGDYQALALAENGLVYTWGEWCSAVVTNNTVFTEKLPPTPFRALWGMCVSSIAAARSRSYAVLDTGELWAWGRDSDSAPLGHGEQGRWAVPKPIESLRGVKVDAVAVGNDHGLALADDGSVYAWGKGNGSGALGLGVGPSVGGAAGVVRTPQRIRGCPGLVGCDGMRMRGAGRSAPRHNATRLQVRSLPRV